MRPRHLRPRPLHGALRALRVPLLLLAVGCSAVPQAPRTPSTGPAEPPAPVVALSLALGAGLGAAHLHARAGALTPARCPCPRDGLPGFDRWAAAGFDAGTERAADVALAVALVAPLTLAVWAAPDHAAALEDAARVVEAAAVAALLTQIAKISVGRPYPYVYGGASSPASDRTGGWGGGTGPRWPEQADDGVNYGSFWSGHTAVPVAAATAAATLFAARHPRSPWRWLVWGAGPALALTAGFLQVQAGNHFPSDVLAGALVGGLVGWGTATLHGLPPPDR